MSLNRTKLENFIYILSKYSDEKVDNQYINDIQKNNLLKYLENMFILNPSILLVGEAPGYKGCTLTGIPFTSEFIINNHNNFDDLKGCIALGKQKESAATIMWDTLDELIKEDRLLIKPLMWNIFPFHPIEGKNVKSNRTPNANECLYGFSILKELLDLFPSIEKIYAIGVKADEKIKLHPKYAGKLRHPARGGKAEFRKGMFDIYINS